MRKRKLSQQEAALAASIIGYSGKHYSAKDFMNAVCFMTRRNELMTASYGEEYLALREMQRKGAVTITGDFGNRIRWALMEYGIKQVADWYGLDDIFVTVPAEGEDG